MGGRALIAGALIASLMAGCGGSSAADGTEKGKTTETVATKPFPSVSTKKIPKFGKKASASEREAASEVLEENLEAREAADFKTQCATLSPVAVKEVATIAAIQELDGGGCVKELTARAEPLKQTKGLRQNTMDGPIDELRVKGDYGYAIWEGDDGNNYAMQMERVDGEWKVADVLLETLGAEG
jgi:hypothetical protein